MYSSQERDSVLHDIDRAYRGLSVSVAGLSHTQSSFKPSGGGWAIAGIVEHLAIVQERVTARIEQLLSAAPDAGGSAVERITDEALKARLTDRTAKFQAPEAAHPTGQPLAHSLDRLAAGRKRVVELVNTAPPDFRLRWIPHPAFGPLDCHQWLIALAGHCARHTEQIDETKAASHFPAR